MSLKAELETWAAALKCYDAQDFRGAIRTFELVSNSSKVLFNVGLIYATIGSHAAAVNAFHQANNLDPYLAVSYFQCGVSNFLLGRYEEAHADFDDAYEYMRGNKTIDYEQLGLKFKLFTCEILFNRGLSLIYMGQPQEGLCDLEDASRDKQTQEHSVIDEAIADKGNGYTVFSIAIGVLYRPSPSKLKNVKSKNYLGQAKLVAATNSNDITIGFAGTDRIHVSSNGPSQSLKPPDLSRARTAAARVETSSNDIRKSVDDSVIPSPQPHRPLRRRATEVTTAISFRSKDLPDQKDNYKDGQSSAPKAGVAVPQNDLLKEMPRVPLERSQSSYTTKVLPRPLDLQRSATSTGFGGEKLSQRSPGFNATSPPFSSENFYEQYQNNSSTKLTSPINITTSPLHFVSSPTYDTRNKSADNISSKKKASAITYDTTRNISQPTIRSPELNHENDSDNVSSKYSVTPPPSLTRKKTVDLSRSRSQSVNRSRTPDPSLSSIESTPPPSLTRKKTLDLSRNLSRSGGPRTATPELKRSNSRAGLSKAPTLRRAHSTKIVSREEEDGYGSGEYEDYIARALENTELQKIRVKLHYDNITRGMSIVPSMTWDEFYNKVLVKFDLKTVGLRYIDEDETMVTLMDESDWESAVDASREFARGRPEGKLEVWVEA